MINEELGQLLERLIQNWENECVEFKESKTDKIGRYFSALANEANLRNEERAWLIFGVSDKTRCVTGTDYRQDDEEHLQSIKHQIYQKTTPNMTFRNVFQFVHENKRVVLFEIPATPHGIPVASNGHYYGRSGESLGALSLDKLDEIRNQGQKEDWSAQVVPDASINDLDPEALKKARDIFTTKHDHLSEQEIEEWSDATFIERLKITQKGKLTRTALLLLGNAESSFLLSPHPTQITWKLDSEEKAYEHFGLPFLLSTSKIYQKIRNIQMRILPENQLLPIEVSKYERTVVLEAMHNCIAHQDYSRNGRVVVTEKKDRLIFENEGCFFEGKPADYIPGERTPRRYRNPFLVQAMMNLNMIDSMGYGIHTMHQTQAKRYLPLPDYEIEDYVKLVIYGSVIDPAYSQLLIQKSDLNLSEILALDRVQKKKKISDEMIKVLRKRKLIEGRKPNFYVSAHIATLTDSRADYIKTRAQDDTFYIKMILDYLDKFGQASRKDIDKLLFDKLSNALTHEQKKNKITNIISKLKRERIIYREGPKATSIWRIMK